MRAIVSRHLTPVRSSRDTLSAVPPGGNPLQPYGHPTAGASLSRMGEDRTANAIALGVFPGRRPQWLLFSHL
ncbi:hypothetical protein [Nostoc sp.]|uniref:hypothetical protein n=1 Tax=Nostoc sp. TaxID=1180 RepID=UPI002FFAD025